MPDFDWTVCCRRLLAASAERFSANALVPEFTVDGAATAPFLLELSSAPSEVWKDQLCVDEPHWLFEDAHDLLRRFVALNVGLGALLLDDADAFTLVAADIARRGSGADVAEEIRWRMADIRKRLLRDVRTMLDRVAPTEISRVEWLAWELVVSFATESHERMVALLDRYQAVSGMSSGASNLLAGRAHTTSRSMPWSAPSN